MTIVEKLLTLRQLVEGKKCSRCRGTGHSTYSIYMDGSHDSCNQCNGTGLDPACAPMLEVGGVRSQTHKGCIGQGRCLRADRPVWGGSCHGTGYVARSWDGLPQGALAGALLHALFMTPGIAIPGQKYLEIIISPFNPDEAALDAVMEALS